MAEEVQLKFGAQTGELTHAIEGVKEQLEGLRGFAEGLTERLKEMFAIHEIVEFVKAMAELGERTERSAAILGTSAETIVELQGIAKATGTSFESLQMGIERFSLNVQHSTRDALSPQAQALKILHLNAKELIGLPVDQYIDRLREAVSKFNPSLNLSNALIAVGGRGFAEMIPMLMKTDEEWKKFKNEVNAAQDGLKEAIPGMAETADKLNIMSLAAQSLGARIFSVLEPAIKKVIEAITLWMESLDRATIQSAIQTVATFTIDLAAAIGGFFITVREEWEKLISSIQDKAPAFHLAAAGLYAMGFQFTEMKAAWQAWQESKPGEPIEQISHRAEEARHSLEGMIESLREMAKELGKVEEHGGHGHEKLSAGAMPGDLHAQLQAALIAQQALIRDAQFAYTQEVERQNILVKTYQTTEREKTKALEAALEMRIEAELAANDEEQRLAAGNVAKLAELEAKRKEILQKGAADRQKLVGEEAIKVTQTWTTALGAIQNAWDSQLQGLLAHTTTWKEAMRKVMADLVLAIIKEFEKVVIVEKLASSLGAAFGSIDMSAIISQISLLIQKAFWGLTSFYAPLGPMAPVAAGATIAAAGVGAYELARSIPKAEAGAWEIPSTSPWLLHKGETVLPSKAAEGFRAMASAAAIGGSALNFNITAMDGTDVVRVLNKHASTFARVLRGHMAANPTSHG